MIDSLIISILYKYQTYTLLKTKETLIYNDTNKDTVGAARYISLTIPLCRYLHVYQSNTFTKFIADCFGLFVGHGNTSSPRVKYVLHSHSSQQKTR